MVRLTVLFRDREEWTTWDLPADITPRHEAPFDVYEWKHSYIEYALYINPEEIQAIYTERQGRG
jgi:hypothetical protein